jgi:iron complex outermembrane receptor protein
VQPAFPNLPGPIVSIDQTNLNLGETRLQGADIDVKVRIPASGYGKVTLALNGTYFDKYETQNTDGTFSSVVGTVQGTTGTGGLVPRWRHYASADWNLGPWDLIAAQTFQAGYHDLPGTFEDPTDPAFQPRRVGPYEVYDLIGTYSGFRNLKLVLGVRNVLDRPPPYSNVGGQNYFQAGYDPSYVDPRGRTYIAALTYRFR